MHKNALFSLKNCKNHPLPPMAGGIAPRLPASGCWGLFRWCQI